MDKEQINYYYNLAESTFLASFKFCIEEALEEEAIKYVDINSIKTERHTVCIIYDYPMFETPFVCIKLDILTNDVVGTGTYSLYIDSEGNELDDWVDYVGLPK